MSDDIVHKRMPKPRKVTIVIVLAMAFANSVTLIVTLMHPVPQFARKGVLMQIGARIEATLAKRAEEPPALPEIVIDGKAVWPSPVTYHTLDPDWTSFVHPLAHVPKTSNTVFLPYQEVEASPSPTALIHFLQVRNPCYHDTCGGYSESKPTTTTKTKTKPKPKPTPGPTPKKKKKPEPESPKMNQKVVDPKAYIDLVIGLLGVCIIRVDGTIACSSAAFAPDYKAVFEQADLDETVISELPTSPGAGGAFVLIAAILHLFAVIIFGLCLIPPFRFFSSATRGKRDMDSRHQNALAISAVIITAALTLTILPTFLLRNTFQKAVKAIPAYNENLQAELGTAFTQLYVVCVLAGLILVQCLLLISEDLRFPWWFSHGAIRRNPFETTEPGLTMTADGLKMDRLAQRYHELQKPIMGKLPDFETIKEASERRQLEAEHQLSRSATLNQDGSDGNYRTTANTAEI